MRPANTHTHTHTHTRTQFEPACRCRQHNQSSRLKRFFKQLSSPKGAVLVDVDSELWQADVLVGFQQILLRAWRGLSANGSLVSTASKPSISRGHDCIKFIASSFVGLAGHDGPNRPEQCRAATNSLSTSQQGESRSTHNWPWVKIQIVPPVNIPIPTKIGSRMGGEFTYQNRIPKRF